MRLIFAVALAVAVSWALTMPSLAQADDDTVDPGSTAFLHGD
mgnify:FL=1